MAKIKKLLVVGLIGVAGLLLTLAGYNLIELSSNLIKYAGLVLLVLTVLMYFIY